MPTVALLATNLLLGQDFRDQGKYEKKGAKRRRTEVESKGRNQELIRSRGVRWCYTLPCAAFEDAQVDPRLEYGTMVTAAPFRGRFCKYYYNIR